MRKSLILAAATATLVLLPACEVRVDNDVEDATRNAGSAIEGAADELGNGLEAATKDAAETLDRAGDALENGVRDVDADVDANVDLDADANVSTDRQ